MAIQVRRGLFINLDPNKLLTGEFAVSTDKQVVHIAFAPGVVKRLSTYEDMKADMQESLQEIINSLTVSIKQATDNANTKANLAEQKAMLADAKAILADQKAQQAQAIVDSASIIINKDLQASYSDKATGMKGTFTTCPVADDGLLHVKEMSGETVQKVTVQGKNICPMFKNKVANGITSTVGTDGTVTLNGTAIGDLVVNSIEFYGMLPSGTYTLSANNEQLSSGVQLKVSTNVAGTIYNGMLIQLDGLNRKNTFTVTDGYPMYVQIYVKAGTILTNFTIKPQLELGSATTYEPFTPNAPSSEYPSPLEYAKEFDAMTCSDNLLPDEHQQSKTVSGVTFIRNSDGSITCNGTASANADYYIFGNYSIVRPYNFTIYANTDYTLNATGNSNVDILMVFGDDMANRNSFQTSTNNLVKRFTYDIRVFCGILRVKNGATVNNVTVYPQLTKGNVALPYIKYKGDQKSISFPFMSVPLNDVKNSFEIVNDKLNKAERVREVVLKGTESINLRTTDPITASFTFSATVMTSKSVSTNLYCSHFLSKQGNDDIEHVRFDGSQTPVFMIWINKSRLTGWNDTLTNTEKVNLFKAWLAANNVTVQYELTTPIYTPIDEIYLETNKGTTNLFTNSYPQVEMIADFKSELWSRDYLQDVALKSKFDAISEIEFTEATSDVDIATKDTLPTLFGKILKSIKTLRSGLALKFDKSDIVQSDTVGGMDKVPSAEVTNVLGQEIDTINNKLTGSYVSDLNAIIPFKSFMFDSNTLNRPANVDGVGFQIEAGGYRAQIAFALGENIMYHRTLYGAWSTWST